MHSNIYEDKQLSRISHIKSHVDNGPSMLAIENIRNNSGDPIACSGYLAGYAVAKAMLAWFEHGNLSQSINWWYVSAQLEKLAYTLEAPSTESPGGKFLAFLPPLLSNNEKILNWFVNNDSIFDRIRIENHKTHDFWAYQGIVALRGEWDRLIARCEKVLSDPPRNSSEQKYLLDHQFYLALAHRNVQTMQHVLSELTTPKKIYNRRNDESGFTRDLISTPALIYAKIAWRSHLEVKIDSPAIPSEWLPATPLLQYDNYFDFLKED